MHVPMVTPVNNALRYGFAVGKVRVLQSRILGSSAYERLLDAPTFAEQRRLLSDTYYGRFFEGVETAEGVERALDEALSGFYAFLHEAALPDEVVRFFGVRHDFANVKAVLKARSLGVPTTGMLSGLGTVPRETFEDPVLRLPEPFAELVDRIESAEEPPTTQEIDTEVDTALYAELVQLARRSRSRFLTGLVRLQIDIANLKVLLRARGLGLTVADIEPMVNPGGSILPRTVLELHALPPLEALERLKAMKGLAALAGSDLTDLSRLDVAADNVIVRYLRVARAVPVGPEPVIAYVFAREAEIVALRIALIGRLSRIDSSVLRERLRESVV